MSTSTSTLSKQSLLKTATQHRKSLDTNEYTPVDLAQMCIKQAKDLERLGIFLEIDEEQILKEAQASHQRHLTKQILSPIDGIPVSIKDNICQKGKKTSCASRMLENYVSPYDATIIQKLRESGAVLFGRTNMDEFAMGSSNENSAFQKTLNPWNEKCVPGGSSGGPAASIAASIVPLALASDTGGSIRQPSSFCGVVGVKPTYGRVSRYGLVAFGSSFDQIGPIARSVEDAALLLSIISGTDPKDATTQPELLFSRLPKAKSPTTLSYPLSDFSLDDCKKLKIGVLYDEKFLEPSVKDALKLFSSSLQKDNIELQVFHSKFQDYLIPTYHILATAEASSNLSRYDGIRYGFREDNDDLKELYLKTRAHGFGPEVKRRILLGTYVLSTGHYDAFYKTAQKARLAIQKEYLEFFKKVDILLMPTSPSTAFEFGAKASPLSMYASDLFTVAANLTGFPAINIPLSLHQGLPIGLQIMTSWMEDDLLLRVANCLEQKIDFAKNYSKPASLV